MIFLRDILTITRNDPRSGAGRDEGSGADLLPWGLAGAGAAAPPGGNDQSGTGGNPE